MPQIAFKTPSSLFFEGLAPLLANQIRPKEGGLGRGDTHHFPVRQALEGGALKERPLTGKMSRSMPSRDFSQKPKHRPEDPSFSSGPSRKHPGYPFETMRLFLAGRSHRSPEAQAQIHETARRLHQVLMMPQDYKLFFVPGSATGALLCGLWNFLGSRAVDIWTTGLFGLRWANEVAKLPLDVRMMLPDFKADKPFAEALWEHDQVFVWSDTASGVGLGGQSPWIPRKRSGLTFCDATSAVLCEALPWESFDLTAFSFQKGFGAEGGLGALVLSPRAMEVLASPGPLWPIPRLLNLREALGDKVQDAKGLLSADPFPFNTPSMWAFADLLASLLWIEKEGGLKAMLACVAANRLALDKGLKQDASFRRLLTPSRWQSPSVFLMQPGDFLQTKEKNLPNGRIVDHEWILLRKMAYILKEENAVCDSLGHKEGWPCLRFWCGPTIAEKDLTFALPWVWWAYKKVLEENEKNQ